MAIRFLAISPYLVVCFVFGGIREDVVPFFELLLIQFCFLNQFIDRIVCRLVMQALQIGGISPKLPCVFLKTLAKTSLQKLFLRAQNVT